MRIVIDRERCTGNGLCYSRFPRFFTDDESGYGQVIGDGSLREESLELARQAMVACPEEAISIEDG